MATAAEIMDWWNEGKPRKLHMDLSVFPSVEAAAASEPVHVKTIPANVLEILSAIRQDSPQKKVVLMVDPNGVAIGTITEGE